MSGGGIETGGKGVKAVVGAGVIGPGGYMDNGSYGGIGIRED